MILGTPTGVEMIGLMQPFAMSLAYQEWTLIAQVDDSLFSFEMNLEFNFFLIKSFFFFFFIILIDANIT